MRTMQKTQNTIEKVRIRNIDEYCELDSGASVNIMDKYHLKKDTIKEPKTLKVRKLEIETRVNPIAQKPRYILYYLEKSLK